MDLSRLPGNPAVKRQLAGRTELAHAYLISGPAGSGKAALAQLMAAAMVCSAPGERPCGACPGCRKAMAGIHPDIIRLSPPEGKREITVDQVRTLRSDAYIRPNEAARKVYLITDAAAMNPSAQNALLKVLEEGPAYAAFLLLCENPGGVLPTIRSRCEGLSLLPPQQPPPAGEDGGAEALAQLLLSGTEAALMEHCISLEKLSREALLDLLDRTLERLHRLLTADLARAGEILPLIALLDELRRQGEFHVGGGHLLGQLCARRFTRDGGPIL